MPLQDLDSSVAIWDAAGNLLAYNDDDSVSFDSFLQFLAPTAGTYYISVHGFTPFGDLPSDPFDSASGGGFGSEGSYSLTIGLNSRDVDYYSFDLEAGDIFGANVFGAGTHLTLFGPSGAGLSELIGSGQDITGAHPHSSPLPGGGNAALSYVIPEAGTYVIAVNGQGGGDYDLQLRDFRPDLELQQTGARQIIFLDFDGEQIDTSVFGNAGIANLSGLDAFLEDWKLSDADLDAVIDSIVDRFIDIVQTDIAANGNNANFDVEILNSRDHADPFGQTNVSRVIIGGTIDELGIPTIGIAESIDVGNFETEESAVVLLDLLSAEFGDPNSLNTYPINPALDPTAAMIDLIGVGVGNIAAHEAGHFFGAWHTDQFNGNPVISDQGGNLANTLGLGADGIFGTADDIDVFFGPPDTYVGNEGFTGTQDALNAVAFGLSGGTNTFNDDNSSIGTASSLGAFDLTTREFVVHAQIQPQAVLLPPLAGGVDEPGHRDIPAENYFIDEDGPAALGTEPVLPDSIQTVYYNFQDVYGTDPQGNLLFNAINEVQKQRTREIFEIYSYYLGIEAVETEDQGITVVTGDMRAISPSIPTGPGGAVGLSEATLDGRVIMDNADFTDPAEDIYGASWFRVAMHEIGHSLGLGHSYDVPSIMGAGLNGEPVFPGDVDLVAARRLFRPDATDIDFYSFVLNESGVISAEIFAERLADVSLLNSVLTLVDADGNVLSRNDDYFSNDSFLELHLDPGTYYIGVTSTGNDNYNPLVSDTGSDGTTDGDYELRISFRRDLGTGEYLVDSTGTAFDGDADGLAGGAFDFWFQTGETIFVDKANAADPAQDGSLTNPFSNIDDALAATTGTTDIVRIVGNGGTDGDLSTTADADPYLVGIDDDFNALEDGSTFVVPQGVTVMIDQGAVLKLQGAIIDVGSNSGLVNRSEAALQVLGTPDNRVVLTAFGNDAIGGDSDGMTDGANPGDWGGLVFRADSDLEDAGIFLNYVNQSDISFGGGQVFVDSQLLQFDSIHVVDARPTVSFNRVSQAASAAISADLDSFSDTIDGNRDLTLSRIGLDVHGNVLVDNSINGMFVRIVTLFGDPIDKVRNSARFDDADVVHIVTENLQVVGNPGGPQLIGGTMEARESGRLQIDPGTIIKLHSSRIEAERGNANIIAEGNQVNRIVLTSLFDDSYGRGGTFDSTNDAASSSAVAGDWGGVFFNAGSVGSIDHAFIGFGGGLVPIEGDSATFNVIEVHQADFRLANSRLENNAAGSTTNNRNGRGDNANAVVFVRGAQPTIIDNVFLTNLGSAISVNANAMQSGVVRDSGRSTGAVDLITDPMTGDLLFTDNSGPLVARNRLSNNSINGLEVRGEELTTESTWDDADIVHVLFDEIIVSNLHTFGGLRLQSDPDASLVIKLSGANAGFTATGTPLEIDDRIGGSLQVVGQPLFPVVLTSLEDISVGAGFDFNGLPQNDTFNSGLGAIGVLPTGPEVNRGTLIDNDVSPLVVGHFEATPQAGGDIGFGTAGGTSGVTAQGLTTLFTNQDFIFDFLNFVDVGSDGNAVNLGATTVTSPPTLISDDLVVSTGTFAGANAIINWTAETRFDDGQSIMFNTITFDSAQPLGNLQFINYLDEDVLGVSDDVLVLTGTPGEADFRAFTLDQAEGIGFSQGGIYLPGAGLENATYDGFAADQFSELRDIIQGAGTTYSVPGNIDLVDLPPIVDPRLGPAFGPNDVTTAFSWTVDPNSNTATITTFLELIATPTGNPAQPGDWRSVRLEQFSHDRNVEVVNELEISPVTGHSNDIPVDAQALGELAPNELSGDENRRLGYEVHGFIAETNTDDRDVYRFSAEAGTQVWIDIDRTDPALNTVVELLDPLGNVLASSIDNYTFTGDGQSLTEDPQLGGDYYTSNPNDAGMRVVLPGVPGELTNYFVRVRSADVTGDGAGDTFGRYQLQVRLRQIDEHPGSTIQHADIRFATNGIEVFGMPGHSPLVGESAEDGTANDAFAQAQDLGNLLTSDRNTISVSGTLDASTTDVDFYSFTLDYDLIQAIDSVNGGTRTWSTIFDIDYADGLARPDTTLSIFDATGQLIYIARESNVQDDQPTPGQGVDFDAIDAGSAGKLDPFLGSVQLPAGVVPAGSSQQYFVAVSSNSQLPSALDSTFLRVNSTNSLIRLEPINSIERIAEDHIGAQGHFGNGGQVAPRTPLFDVFDNISIDSHITPFSLQDVVLFTAADSFIDTVDSSFGHSETFVGQVTEAGVVRTVTDVVLRSDGRMFGISGNRLLEINSGDATATLRGLLNIPTLAPSPSLPSGLPTGPQLVPLRALMNNITVRQGTVEAMTFERTGFNVDANVPVYSLVFLIQESGLAADGTPVTFQKLYRGDGETGNSATGFQGILSDPNGAALTIAEDNLFGIDGGGNFAHLLVQAVVPGDAGNQIFVNIQAADLPNLVTITPFGGGTLINVRIDSNPAQNTQALVDLINGSAANQYIKVGFVGNGATNAVQAFAGAGGPGNAELITGGGTGTAYSTTTENFIRGISYDDFFGGFELHGVTYFGDIVSFGDSDPGPNVDIPVTTLNFVNGFGIAGTPDLGLEFTSSTFLVDSNSNPPDAMGAVGMDHIVEMINGNFEIFDKATGASLDSKSLNQFWIDAGATVTTDMFDPRVIYDPTVDRWFATSINSGPAPGNGGNDIFVAVSETGDPTGNWNAVQFLGDSVNGFQFNDFDTLGIDADGVYITTNNFNKAFSVSVFSIPKADLLLAAPTLANMTRFENLDPFIFGDSIQPVVDFEASDGRAAFVSASGFGEIIRFDVLGAGGPGATLSTPVAITVPTYFAAPFARQPAPGGIIDTVSPRFSGNVVEVDGSIWAVHTVEDPAFGTAAIRWYEIDEATNEVLQTGVISDPSQDLDFYNASIAVNGDGDVVIGSSGSGDNQSISSYASFGFTVDGVTRFLQPVLVHQGVGTFDLFRWGDYSATVVDPSDPDTFWTFQEFVSANDEWSIRVSELQDIDVNANFQAPILDQAIRFTGAALGPQNLFDGAYANTIFAIAEDGRVLAFNSDGDLQDVFGPDEGIGTYWGFAEVEPNDSVAAAMDLDELRFLQNFDVNVGALDANGNDVNTSSALPHLTIRGTGNGTDDYYKFTINNAGDRVIFDIDGGSGFGAGDFDAFLTLLDTDGVTVLATNDDMYFTTDAGSNSDLDSLLDFDGFAAPGTYYLKVSAFDGSNPVPIGADYALHVSIENHTVNAGQAPVVRIGSSGDPLVQADATTTILQTDDDSGTFFDSLIDTTLQAGTYVVVVGAFDSDINSTGTDVVGSRPFGNYQLNVSLSDRTAVADPGIYTENENNNSFIRAQNLNRRDFTLAANGSVTDSTIVPHLSIDGVGDGTFDYYMFTVTADNTRAILETTATDFDTELFLFAYDRSRSDFTMQTDIFAPTGLAFSPLDFNLWHPTEQRTADAGHGVNPAADNSRDGTTTIFSETADGRLYTESSGGLSLYFGLEEFTLTPDLSDRYVTYEGFSQLGIQNSSFQRDLASNTTIGDNYNLPGGAQGSLLSSSFSLAGYDSTDRPTLYFNYFLATEDTNSATGLARDTARVFVSTDGGATYQPLSTNNEVTRAVSSSAELPTFFTHTASENPNGFFDSGVERVQELFDNNGGWRQARVDLGEFAGQSNLMLRFDFSTAGAINDPDAPRDLNLPGEQNGNFNSNERGLNNQFEGFFIDDIIIGFAERGEMVTGGVAGQSGFTTTPRNPVAGAPSEQLVGAYQLEIRRGTEYAVNLNDVDSDIAIVRTFDTNDRLVSTETDTELSPGDLFYGRSLLGDDNARREQGHLGIVGNKISNVSGFGIVVDAGPRDAAGNLPHPGSARTLPTLNADRLAPGAFIENNVIANFGQGGILFQGDANAGGPLSVLPFGRIVNNTIYGGQIPTGTGIQVGTNASPTIVNNIVSNTDTAIADAGTGTVVTTTVFKGNNNNGVVGSNAIQLAVSDPLFVDPSRLNFYLTPGSSAIDSSINRLEERPTFAAVKTPLGIPNSDIFAPDLDIFGQKRVDDPTQAPPPGLGFQVFKDRGAIERSDSVGPIAELIVPVDNGPEDLDPDLSSVFLLTDFPSQFVIQLTDLGIGIDDFTVNSGQFTLLCNGAALTEGIDYLFIYNANTNEVTFSSTIGTFPLALYEIIVNNAPGSGVSDLAGNALQGNQPDGSLTFTIALGPSLTITPIGGGGTGGGAGNNEITIAEGDSGFTEVSFEVSLNTASTEVITVDVMTSDGTATTADADYVEQITTLTFNPGDPLTQTVTVQIVGDITPELDENFFVTLANATNASIAPQTTTINVVNDDFPTVTIDDVTVLEGDVGEANFAIFTVTISQSDFNEGRIDFTTVDGSAVAGQDYVATAGTLVFSLDGATTQQILVQILGDNTAEGNENFFLQLSNPVGLDIIDAEGEATIIDEIWDALRAAGPGGTAVTSPLLDSELDPVAAQALAYWNSQIVDPSLRSALQNVDIQIVDLSGNLLGLASDDTILIDIDAAGYGWFVDATPSGNEEFVFNPITGQYEATSGDAEDRIDLLTVLLHEMGHIAGLDDLSAPLAANDLMAGALDTGMRRLPNGSHGVRIVANQADDLVQTVIAGVAPDLVPNNWMHETISSGLNWLQSHAPHVADTVLPQVAEAVHHVVQQHIPYAAAIPQQVVSHLQDVDDRIIPFVAPVADLLDDRAEELLAAAKQEIGSVVGFDDRHDQAVSYLDSAFQSLDGFELEALERLQAAIPAPLNHDNLKDAVVSAIEQEIVEHREELDEIGLDLWSDPLELDELLSTL